MIVVLRQCCIMTLVLGGAKMDGYVRVVQERMIVKEKHTTT